MSDDSTSQSQVESLLRAMQAGANATTAERDLVTASADAQQPGTAVAQQSAQPTAAVALYDFKQRQRVSPEQMQSVRSLHETIAHQFGGAASGLLRSVVQCKLLSISQRTYGEFIMGLENPSCLHVLSADPLKEAWLLDITPALAYPVVDRLLGGDAEPGYLFRRELTEIETHLLRRLVNLFLTQAMQAWQAIAPLQLAIDRVERDPHLALLVPPSDVVIAIALEVTLGRSHGLMNLCIPAESVTGLERRPSKQGRSAGADTQPSDTSRQAIATNVDHASVELTVTLARSKIRTAELLDLAVGDVITTEQEVAAPLELSVQGTPKFLARPGAHRGRKAVCIQGLIQS